LLQWEQWLLWCARPTGSLLAQLLAQLARRCCLAALWLLPLRWQPKGLLLLQLLDRLLLPAKLVEGHQVCIVNWQLCPHCCDRLLLLPRLRHSVSMSNRVRQGRRLP
jgi:hypothetical protein